MICETNWNNGLPYSTDIDPYYWDFGNGYIPFFAVVGAYNVLYYGDNAVTGAMTIVPDAVESFNSLGLTGPIEDQVTFFNEVLTIDVSEVFSSPNGDVTVTVDDNTNPAIAETEITGNTLTITALSTMGQTIITLMGDDGVMTATDDFQLTVLDPNPNIETLEFTLEDSPAQANYPNNPNPYDDTYIDYRWTSVMVEEDAAIISMHITGDLFSDNYASEGSLWMTSPTGTDILIADGFTAGTNAVDFEIADFVTQPCSGLWIIHFIDSYGDGGHGLSNGAFIIEIAASGAPVVAPTNLEAAVAEDDVHLTWDYENPAGRIKPSNSMPQKTEVHKLNKELFSQAKQQNSNLRDRLLLGFKVYRDDAEITYIEDMDSREYDDMDLAYGTYEYYVTAVFDSTESDGSNTVEVVINTNPSLAPPSNVSVTENGLITWMEPNAGLGSILFVDDDGSIDIGHTNTYPQYEIILNAYGATWDYYEIELSDNDGPDAAYMANYDLVIWECGEQWTSSNTLTVNDEAALATYLDAGGFLVLSSHDYLYDRYLSAGAFSAGQFPYDYLGVESAVQDAFTVGVFQGGPEMVDIVGQGATAGLTVGLQDI
ncbi:MAG: hypothetical protein P9X26_03815, partial [Candidatus Stygibacter frigidus]|nr:hypothetical protein [Candidatus Stygibacter frigidus]